MDRKTFLCRSVDGVLGCCAALAFGSGEVEARQAAAQAPPAPIDSEKEFIQTVHLA